MSTHYLIILFEIVAIRTVKAGQQMVAEGEKLIAEGWDLYEKAMAEAGMGELPQLLRSVRSSLTPTRMMTTPPTLMKPPTSVKPPTPTKTEEGREEKGECSGGVEITPIREGGPESPITIQVKKEGGIRSYQYGCPQCDVIKAMKRGMDSHIRQVHTLRAFVCCYCEFSTYNMDSLQRHEKVHNK